MRKPTAKQIREAQKTAAELQRAWDEGYGWFENHSGALLAEVCRQASAMYDSNEDNLGKAFVLSFVLGFTQARERREEWLKEQAQ